MPTSKSEPGRPPRSALGRADLLRYLALLGDCPSLTLQVGEGEWLGFQRKAPPPPSEISLPFSPTPTPTKAGAKVELPPRQRARLYGVTVHEIEETPPPDDPNADAGTWDPDLAKPRTPGLTLPHRPLIPWPRFSRALDRTLKQPGPGGLDLDRLIAALGQRQPPRYLPRRQVPRWPAGLIVLFDHGPGMQPYARDLAELRAWLLRWQGGSGLVLHHLRYGPDAPWADGLADDPLHARLYPPPQRFPAGARVLIVSDLGRLDRQASVATPWRNVLRRLRRADCRVEALCPMSAAHLASPDPHLAGLPALCWNPATPATRRQFHRAEPTHPDQESPALLRLMALLAVFCRVDPPLLRALRGLDPELKRDAGLEGQAWNHPHLVQSGATRWIAPEHQDAHLARFAALSPAEMSDARLMQLLALRELHHGQFDRGLEHEEILRLTTHLRPHLRGTLQEGLKQAAAFFANLRGGTEEHLRGYARDLVHFADPATRHRHSRILGPVLTFGQAGRPGEIAEGLKHQDVLGSGPIPEAGTWLVQQGDDLVWQDRPAPGGRSLAGPLYIASLDVREKTGSRLVHRWTGQPQTLAHLTAAPLHIEAAGHALTLDDLQAPWWSLENGRDRQGAYCLAPLIDGRRLRLDLPLRDAAPRVQLRDGAEFRHGRDDYGWYADMELRVKQQTLTQRLRWIPPGEFLMGSPEDEPERDDDEGPRHPVILTQGYWLADTACTQALWTAVMGSNPSEFKNAPENPVESVSWNDAQDFLKKLGELAGVEAALPSEAQWEYACRAGTATPFWWGSRLTSKDANFDGKSSYGGGEKGEYRQHTLPVKSFRPNPWGLWQMHGNVLEWCRDDPRAYADAVAVDPESPHGEILGLHFFGGRQQVHLLVDPERPPGKGRVLYGRRLQAQRLVDPEGPSGEDRALRGGSWFSYGSWLRAANRNRYSPGDRNWIIGLRFLLRSPGPGAGTAGV